MASPTIVTKSLPLLKRMWIPFLNLIGKKDEFRIVVTSPDYVEFRVFWGLISYEKGEKKEFVIRGTDRYINSIISSLKLKNLDVEKLFKENRKKN